jgi:hypothetical protein
VCPSIQVDPRHDGIHFSHSLSVSAERYSMTLSRDGNNRTIVGNTGSFTLPVAAGTYQVTVLPLGIDTSSASCPTTSVSVQSLTVDQALLYDFESDSLSLFSVLPSASAQPSTVFRQWRRSRTLSSGAPLADHSSGSGQFMVAPDTGDLSLVLVSGVLDLSSLNATVLSFWYINNAFGSALVPGVLEVFFDASDDAVYGQWWRDDYAALLASDAGRGRLWSSLSAAGASGWTQVSVDLPASSVGRLRFVASSADTKGSADIALDDVRIEQATPIAAAVSSSGLSGGAIAGIVIGVIIAVLLIAALVVVGVLFWRRKHSVKTSSYIDSSELTEKPQTIYADPHLEKP